MATRIYRYVLDIPRSSDVEGVFLLTDKDLKAIKKLQGQVIDYGEIAGKHSDVSCEFDQADLEMVSEDPAEVKFFKRLFPHGTGYDFKTDWLEA